jgi:hypothetical protein
LEIPVEAPPLAVPVEAPPSVPYTKRT